jgi:hydrogenase expression/formation protein HypC
MCLSMPGRVESLEGPRALVDTAGVKRWCNALMYPDLQIGDRVLLHAGLVIEIVSEERALEIENAFEELGAAVDG